MDFRFERVISFGTLSIKVSFVFPEKFIDIFNSTDKELNFLDKIDRLNRV